MAFSRGRFAALLSSLILGLLFCAVNDLWASNVTLAWDASTDSSVVGYNIYYGGTSATYTNTVTVEGVTTATVSNLLAGSTYYFAATSLSAAGLESGFSTEISYTVPLPNQPPTLDPIANVAINQGAGFQIVNLTGITSGATNEAQTLTVTASSSNPALIPAPAVSYTSPSSTGSLSFTPAVYGNGTATITVTVDDGGASNNVVTRSFTVTVNPVNQPPTLNALANITVNQNSGVQAVSLTGITSGASDETQTLTVTANSSNPALIPTPTISYTSPNSTGSLSFTPLTNGYGTASITVTVNDGGASNNIVTRSFNVTVNALPTISSLTNLTIAADTHTPAIPFTVSDAETSADALILSASSSNPTLVPAAGIVLAGTTTNRTVTVSPMAGQIGMAAITISVSDGFATNSTTFQLSVEQRPPPPGNFRVVGF